MRDTGISASENKVVLNSFDLKGVAISLLAIILLGAFLQSRWQTGEYIFIPSIEHHLSDTESLKDSLPTFDITNKPFPATNLYSPLGILSMNSDYFLADLLGSESDYRAGMVFHNILFLTGTAFVAVLLGYSLGFSGVSLLLFALPIVAYPFATSSLPLLQARPWFMGAFWQLLAVFAYVQSIETKKIVWNIVLFLSILVGSMSLPSSIGVGISIIVLMLLHHDRDSENSPKPLLLSVMVAVIIFFAMRLVSSINTPIFASNIFGESLGYLGNSVFPFFFQMGGDDLVLIRHIIGLAAFASVVYLSVWSWIGAERSDKESERTLFLAGYLGRSNIKGASLASKVLFLMMSSVIFNWSFNSFDLLDYLRIAEIESSYFQFIPIGIQLMVAIIILSKASNRSTSAVMAVVLCILFLLSNNSSVNKYKDEGLFLESVGIDKSFISDFYLDKSKDMMLATNFPLALESLIQAERLNPDNPLSNKMRGLYYAGIQDLIQAERYLTQYLEKTGFQDDEAVLAIANIRIALEEYDVAEDDLFKLLSYYPESNDAIALLAVVYLKKDDFRKAADQARKLISSNYIVDYLAIEFLNYGVGVFDKNENMSLEAWDLSGQLNPNYIKPYEKFLVYYVEYYPDFRRALWCVEQIRGRGGEVSGSVMKKIYEITPPSMRPDLETFEKVM